MVDPLNYFSFQPVLQDRCNRARGMCYHVCVMVDIKEPLLLIGNSSLCSGFSVLPHSLFFFFFFFFFFCACVGNGGRDF